MNKRIKKQDHEDLSEATIKKVLQLLSAEKPITKKDACGILNISYNTTRLQKILDQFVEDLAFRKDRMAQKRGRPADNGEISLIVEEYLTGKPVSTIAKLVFRSSAFVKNIVERVGVPDRVAGLERQEVEFLPEPCVSDKFSIGEIAWSARHHTSCEVMEVLVGDIYKKNYDTECYVVYVRESSEESQGAGYYANLASYDIGKLEHLKEFGVSIGRI